MPSVDSGSKSTFDHRTSGFATIRVGKGGHFFPGNLSFVQTVAIPHTDLVVPRLAYGCMRISGSWDPAKITAEDRAKGRIAVHAAFEAGYRLFDHADIYAQGECEKIFGEALSESEELRRHAVIATKCGIRFSGDPNPDSPHRYDFSRAHILRSCDRSLERLGVERIDIYQLHRPDLLMDPDEVADAFTTLRAAGKVDHFGVSNFLPSFVTALQASLDAPLVVNQVEIHLGRLDCLYDGTLDQCLTRKLLPLSWSPIGGGWLGDGGTADDPKQRKILETLDEIATSRGVSCTAVALARLLRHPTQIVPIVGSANPQRIRDAVAADAIDLGREEWTRLLVAARGEELP